MHLDSPGAAHTTKAINPKVPLQTPLQLDPTNETAKKVIKELREK